MKLSGYFKSPRTADAPTLILMHAFPLDGRMWNPFIETLHDLPIGVFAPNLRGYDATPVPTPEEDCNAWSIEVFAQDIIESLALNGIANNAPLILMGSSMGAYIAFELWRKYPERIKRLFIVDSRANADSEAARNNRKDQRRKLVEGNATEIVTAMINGLLAPVSRRNEQLLRSIQAITTTIPIPALSGTLHALGTRPDSTSTLATITIPTMIIVGSQDTVSPPNVAFAMASAIEGASIREIEDAGHLPSLEQTEVFVDTVKPFLEI